MSDVAQVSRQMVVHCSRDAADADGFVRELSVVMFSQPYSALLDPELLPYVPEPLRSCLAVLEFDTELQMQGFFTLLGNSTGLLLHEVARSLEVIGAVADAEILRSTLAYLATHGVTSQSLRNGAVARDLYAVSSFEVDHPNEDPAVWREVERMTKSLGDEHGESLIAWLQQHWPIRLQA